jgi:hypothetical protein
MATPRTPKASKSQRKSPKPAKKPTPRVASKAKPKPPAKPKPAKPAKKAAAPAKPAKGKSPPPKAAAKAPPPKAAPPKAAAKAPPPKAAPSKAAAPAQRPAIAPPRPSNRPEPITLVAPRSSSGGAARPLVVAGKSPVMAKRAQFMGSAPVGGSRSSAPPARGVTLVRRTTDRPVGGAVQPASLPIPVRRVEAAPSIEQRFTRIEARIKAVGDDFAKRYYALFDRSWIYHDSALEGVVYTQEELEAGLGGEPIVTDSSLQPAADQIRRHKEAIDFVRDFGMNKKLPATVDVIKKIYLILHPSEGDLKTVKYRKDVPQHRLYFHEYAQPDKIAYKVRQIADWLNEPETKKTKSPLRIAARAHYDLLRVFPFQNDSGKVARLFMNLLLFRAGYPPALIHATERQRYYDALKGEPNTILRIVQESVDNGLASVERMLDERDAKNRGPA